MAGPPEPDLLAWLERQRWYGDTGRAVRVLGVESVPLPDGSDTYVTLVRLDHAAGASTYHVPLRRGGDPEPDGVITPEPLWSDALASADGASNLVRALTCDAGRLSGEWLDPAPPTGRVRPYRTEQSNSAVIAGDGRYFVKVLRRVHPGRNPEVELGRALRAAGSDHVARYVGSLTLQTDAGGLDLVVAHELLHGTDGFTLALRDSDLDRQGLPGEQFPGAAYELGIGLGAVHSDLAAELGEQEAADGCARLGRRLLARLDAVADVPELAPYLPVARAVFERVAARPDPAALQRIHGDLHLGQALFTETGWRLVDFEGEPRRPLAQRTEPDSPMRDLAGVIRSFDYAARWRGGYAGAGDWQERSVEMFLEGYRLSHPDGYDEQLLEAFVLDKALYEVGYERTYRPEHTGIPLSAVARLCA